jgi:hypothetical protein
MGKRVVSFYRIDNIIVGELICYREGYPPTGELVTDETPFPFVNGSTFERAFELASKRFGMYRHSYNCECEGCKQ